MLVQGFEQQFNAAFQKALSESSIGFTPSETWYERALLALGFASPLSLGIAGNSFLEILNAHGERKLNCLQFAILSNNLELRTPRDLGLLMSEYAKFMIEVGDYSEKWNEQTGKIREAVMQVELALAAEKVKKETGKVRKLEN